MTITVDTTGMRDAIRQRYTEVVVDAFQAMLLDMERDAPRDTGAMTQTMTIDANDGDTNVARTIHAPQEYSSYQDEGTGPIYPVNAKALRFVAKDGTVVFVKSTRGVPRTGWFSDPTGRLEDYLRGAMA